MVSTLYCIELIKSNVVFLPYQLMDRGVKSILRMDPDIKAVVYVLTRGTYIEILVVRVVLLRLWFDC